MVMKNLGKVHTHKLGHVFNIQTEEKDMVGNVKFEGTIEWCDKIKEGEVVLNVSKTGDTPL